LQIAMKAFRSGTEGDILKGNVSDVIFEAVRDVNRGKRYICPETAESLAAAYVEEGRAVPVFDKKKKKKSADVNWRHRDDSPLAYKEIERRVKKLLKFASTAKFPDLSERPLEHVLSLENQCYSIKSHVDSMNVQGNIARTYFTAELQQFALGKWDIIALDLG